MEATIAAVAPVVAKSKPKSSLFPVLVVLFLVSYGLLTMLVVEQDRTISAQRTLISQLYGDSLELTALKTKEIQKQQHAVAPAHPKAPAENNQVAPLQKTPHAGIQNDSGKLRRRLLEKPKGVEDTPDSRRALDRI